MNFIPPYYLVTNPLKLSARNLGTIGKLPPRRSPYLGSLIGLRG